MQGEGGVGAVEKDKRQKKPPAGSVAGHGSLQPITHPVAHLSEHPTPKPRHWSSPHAAVSLTHHKRTEVPCNMSTPKINSPKSQFQIKIHKQIKITARHMTGSGKSEPHVMITFVDDITGLQHMEQLILRALFGTLSLQWSSTHRHSL